VTAASGGRRSWQRRGSRICRCRRNKSPTVAFSCRARRRRRRRRRVSATTLFDDGSTLACSGPRLHTARGTKSTHGGISAILLSALAFPFHFQFLDLKSTSSLPLPCLSSPAVSPSAKLLKGFSPVLDPFPSFSFPFISKNFVSMQNNFT